MTNEYHKMFAPAVSANQEDFYGIRCPAPSKANSMVVAAKLLLDDLDLRTYANGASVWFRKRDQRDRCWDEIVIGPMNQ